MEKINELPPVAFKKLSIELGKLPYIDRIKVLYQRFGEIHGKKTVSVRNKEYTISTDANTNEENLERWKYYLEEKAREWHLKFKTDRMANIDEAPDKARAANILLEEIESAIKSNYIMKRGHDYAITRSGLDWINKSPLSEDHSERLFDWYRGLGYYYVEEELKKFQGDKFEEDAILDTKADFSVGYRLVLLVELGIIKHLQGSYDVQNQPVKIVKVLAEILGIDVSNGKNRSFVASVNHLLNNNIEQGPLNPTSKARVEGFLKEIKLNPFIAFNVNKSSTKR